MLVVECVVVVGVVVIVVVSAAGCGGVGVPTAPSWLGLW